MSVTAFECAECYPKMCRCPQPKGSMCFACVKIDDDCSGLDFKSMPVIDTYPDGTQVVKCTEFTSGHVRVAK